MLKQFQTLKNMTDEEKMLNSFLLFSWGGILSILVVTYTAETIKGSFSLQYLIHFLIASLVPYGVCLYRFTKNSKNLKYWIVVCYCIMYSYVLITGHTLLVFTYIFPILTFLILYHDPKLIRLTGGITLILNIFFIIRDYYLGRITLLNSRDYEIQIALIILCFLGSHESAKLYNRISILREKKEKEILQLKMKQALLEEEKKFANLDYLTRLFNRKKFDESLNELVTSSFEPFYFISLDINGLKKCNDTYGHLAGDELLTGMAQCMTSAFPQGDNECFRISGDEFAIICRSSNEDFCQKFQVFQDNIINWKGSYGYHLSASIGYVYVLHLMDTQEILRLADEQMYREKEKYYADRKHDRRA